LGKNSETGTKKSLQIVYIVLAKRLVINLRTTYYLNYIDVLALLINPIH